MRISLVALLLLLLIPGYSYAQPTGSFENVLIETQKPYDNVVRAIEALGGRVTFQYAYVNAIAAEIPVTTYASVSSIHGVTAVYKDDVITKPSSIASTRGNSIQVSTESSTPVGKVNSKDLAKLAITSPGYSINNAGTRIESLHARGLTGQGTTVAVIDSGVRGGFKLVQDAIIGGIDFVDDGAPGPAADGQADWKQSSNDGHGTFVAGLIAGNYTFSVNQVMKQALLRYAPGALINGNLPLIGTAPDAKIYVVRVFGDAGARVSTVLAAIHHVIEQRQLYVSSGGRQGIKIDVANLSLGISTLAAGRTLLDTSIDEMLEAGIVPVVAVGDTGPSTLTNLSPGTSRSALSVGASSVAVNERILYEVQYGTQFQKEFYPGIGADIRPFSGTEVQWFSSRGPSSDGRLDPDVVANGVGNLSQGYCPNEILDACFKRLSIGSGTSFSAPIVSGIAAVLTQAFPNATATQIRNAIIASGQLSAIEPYFDVLDRGRGVPDANAAYALLEAGASDVLPPLPPQHTLVRDNIEDNTGLLVQSGSYGKSFVNMKPGQRAEILYEVPVLADYVRVRVNNVVMNGPQNPFFRKRPSFPLHSQRQNFDWRIG
jgi:serine protease AprX